MTQIRNNAKIKFMNDINDKKLYPHNVKMSNATASFDSDSPWKNSDTAFNWINFEYPLLHGHKDWEIFIVLEGKILHTINGKISTMHAGTSCLVGPQHKHCYFFANNNSAQHFQAINFLVRKKYFDDYFGLLAPNFFEKIKYDTSPLYFNVDAYLLNYISDKCLQIQTLENMETTESKEQCNLLVSTLLLEFCKQFDSSPTYPDWLNTFIKQLILPANFCNYQNLLSTVPYSYSHTAKLFKEYLGVTIIEYVNNLKVRYACELLQNSDMTILQISSALNFDSLSHFYHIFKKAMDMTPYKYRRLHGTTK